MTWFVMITVKSLIFSIIITIRLLKAWTFHLYHVAVNCDPVNAAIERYAFHPSIAAIKSRVSTVLQFELNGITEDEMLKEIHALDGSEKVSGSIPTKILKMAAKECAAKLDKML